MDQEYRKTGYLWSKSSRKNLSGYMTLEASLLMPMLVVGIVFTIYIGFYLYNVCLVYQNAYLAALRGSLLEEASFGEIEAYTLDALEELTQGRWMAAESITKEVSVGFSRVTVSLGVTVKMPFSEFLSDQLEVWEIEETATAARIYPVTVIRGLRRLTQEEQGG